MEAEEKLRYCERFNEVMYMSQGIIIHSPHEYEKSGKHLCWKDENVIKRKITYSAS